MLGTRQIPGKQGWWTQEEHEFVVPVRDQRATDCATSSTRRRSRAGTYRILVLGDSFVEALQVPLETTFARQLEGLLKRRDGRRSRS